jgi:hypothetical protein
MTEQVMPHIKKVISFSKVICFLLIIFYLIFCLVLYKHYLNKIETERSVILQQYYDKVVSVSTEKLNSISHKILANIKDQDVTLVNDVRDIKICRGQCVEYSIFRLGNVIDKHIPEFIHFKIELNKNLLYSNFKEDGYQLEKVYHINSGHQFVIGISIDKVFGEKLASDIIQPFWTISYIILTSSILVYFLYGLLIKHILKSYLLDYQLHSQREIECINKQHAVEIDECKSSLMNEIWNKNFVKQKDLEINYLFALEANRIALVENPDCDEDFIGTGRIKQFQHKVPCSIVLYQVNQREEIYVKELVDLFTSRFEQDNKSIKIEIVSAIKVTYFCTKVALYQIIYSFICNLAFVLNKQSATSNKYIKVSIINIDEEASIKIEYNGIAVKDKNELIKLSTGFFQSHANPFILNINKVLSLLESNNFTCNIENNESNTIQISKKSLQVVDNDKKDNIIFLSSKIKKRNE